MREKKKNLIKPVSNTDGYGFSLRKFSIGNTAKSLTYARRRYRPIGLLPNIDLKAKSTIYVQSKNYLTQLQQ